jgi:hypothetical protein
MPEKEVAEKARRKLRSGRSPTTAAGEFVREEMHHVRKGKHGARSARQAIAIGLSKARRAGVPLAPPKRGAAKRETREAAARAYEVGQGLRKPRAPSKARSRATGRALRREPHRTVSHRALSTQARRAASRRSPAERRAAARKAAATKGPVVRRRAAHKAARTRRRRSS